MGRGTILAKPRAEKLPIIREVQRDKPRSFFDPPAGTRALRVRRPVKPSPSLEQLIADIDGVSVNGRLRQQSVEQLGLSVLQPGPWTRGERVLSVGALEHHQRELQQLLVRFGQPAVTATVDDPPLGFFGAPGNPIPQKPWISLRLRDAQPLQREANIAAQFLRRHIGAVSLREFTPHVSLMKAYSPEDGARAMEQLQELDIPSVVTFSPAQVVNLATRHQQIKAGTR